MIPTELFSTYQEAAVALQDAKTVVITTHINPDGDGVGAGLALVLALRGLGGAPKQIRFLCPSPVVSIYRYLPEFACIEVVADAATATAQAPADVVISCDAGDRERIGEVWKVRRTTFINLDHHATNTNFGDINLVDLSAESSGVAVYRLLQCLDVPLDRKIAECLYTTIVFDTGRFMHSNTTAHTFRFASMLMETGIDAAAINRLLTYTRTPLDLAIQRLGLTHLRIDTTDDRIAGIALRAEDIAAVGEPEDWGDLVEIPRSLRGNQIAYLLRERQGKDGSWVVRASMRSNPPYAIGAVAQAHGGGGHAQAAGATIPGRLAEVEPELVKQLRQVLAAQK